MRLRRGGGCRRAAEGWLRRGLARRCRALRGWPALAGRGGLQGGARHAGLGLRDGRGDDGPGPLGGLLRADLLLRREQLLQLYRRDPTLVDEDLAESHASAAATLLVARLGELTGRQELRVDRDAAEQPVVVGGRRSHGRLFIGRERDRVDGDDRHVRLGTNSPGDRGSPRGRVVRTRCGSRPRPHRTSRSPGTRTRGH